MLSFLAILLLAGIGAALWSREHAGASPERGDGSVRLLAWATGLLPADRVDWGQAMLAELEQIESRSARRRFALGCVSTVVLMPPWGPVAPIFALIAVALGSAVVFGIGFVHFRLATLWGNWVVLGVLAVLVVSFLLAVSVMLRRRAGGRLGLMSGAVVAAAWLAFSRFTFAGVISPFVSVGTWPAVILMLALPVLVGVGSTWYGGSAVAGRRTAQLAGLSAGLVMFFVATIAVVAIDGGPRDPGVGITRGVSEAFFNVAMLFLVGLPLATAGIGWVAATITDRLRFGGLEADQMRGSASLPAAVAAVDEENAPRIAKPATFHVLVAVLGVATVILIILVK